MTDYNGVTWRVNYGEISEREQFRVGYIGQDSFDAYFEVDALGELIGILTTVQGLGLGQMATGTTLQARKVDAGHITEVVIEPRSDQFPPQIMRLELSTTPDLVYALQLFQTALGGGDSEPDDWDNSESYVLDHQNGKIRERLLPDRLSDEALHDEFAGAGDVADLETLVDEGRLSAGVLSDTFTGKSKSPLMILDYAVGDGVADDTAGVLAAFTAAVSQGRSLYSPPGKEYLVGPLQVSGALQLEGAFTFSARLNGQAHVLLITETVDWSRAYVYVNGKNRAQYGIRGSDFGRSSFGHLEVQRCTIWGFQFDPIINTNNNVVSVEKFVARLNGAKSTQVLTETAETANVLTSSTGYGTFTLATPLTAAQVASNVTYWVISAGLAYKVRAVTTTTIEIFNLKAGAGVGGTISVDIIIGGGLNIPSFGDNGVGAWGSMDISANLGVGVHIASLYGHIMSNLVLQANSMGFTCSDYTTQLVLDKPYFENNTVNYVSWSYVAGVMIAPLMELETIQNCINRLAGNGSYDPKLIILKDSTSGLTSDLVPGLNPGSRTLTPGQSYAYHRTSASSWAFVINNHPRYAALGAYFIMVDLSHSTTNTTYPLSITLANNNGDTIEGNAFAVPFAAAVTGKVLLKIYRVGTDWKVTITPSRTPASAVAAAPTYVGQLAVSGGLPYIAVGVATAADWKQITTV